MALAGLSVTAREMPKPTNPLVSVMLTDYYQFSMAYTYWKHGRHEEQACFELFFRKTPFQGEFAVFAGLEEVLRFVESFGLSTEDVEYLRAILPDAEEAFFEWLGSLTTAGLRVYAIEEGTVVFAKEPLLRVHGPLALAQLLETTLLNLVNFASLVCTNAARFRLAAGPDKKLFEFGARRAQGPDGALSASRYAYIGGFDGTSHVLAGQKLGLPVSGTHSHAFVQAHASLADIPEAGAALKESALAWRRHLGYENAKLHDGELAAFISYALAFPRAFVALVDTYSTLDTGLHNFVCVALALSESGYQPLAIRIDSGDLAYLSMCARETFDRLADRYPAARCLRDVKIVASNDVNESVLLSLREQAHSIDAFGIGTHLVTCDKQPALGCVYKLVEINGQPTYKLSNDIAKTTIPYAKAAYRLLSADSVMLLDLLLPRDHAPPEVGERILCRHPFDYQKRVYVIPSLVVPLHRLVFHGDDHARHRPPPQPRPSIDRIKARVADQLALVRNDVLRHINPCPYKVSLSADLHADFAEMRQTNEPIVELS